MILVNVVISLEVWVSAIAWSESVVLAKSSQSAVDSLLTSFATIELSAISPPATEADTRWSSARATSASLHSL